MRGLILLTMCTDAQAHAAWNGYVETRGLCLDAEGIDSLIIRESGSGCVRYTDVPGMVEYDD